MSTARVVSGALPGGLLAGPGVVIERNLRVWRHRWVILVGGMVDPLLYLVAMGVGLGGLIGEVPGPQGTPVPYATYVMPALLASAAMNGAFFESFNIYFKLKEQRTYDAALATPLTPRDIAAGEIAWSLLRAGLYGAGFLTVAAFTGLVRSPWGILALPASLLVGFAFGGLITAATTFMRSVKDFDLMSLAVVPIFLGSATFYPLEVYPRALQLIAQASPLYHGVALTRALTLGALGPGLLVHVAVLVAVGVVGVAVASRRIGALLLR